MSKDSNLSLVEASPTGEVDTKACRTCGVEKSLDHYYNAKHHKDGKMNICKPCDTERRRMHNEKNPDMRKNRDLKWRYGISLEQWDQMYLEQEGKCAACGIHQSEIDKVFCVDHNHETGEVRSLLCNPCNSTVGFAKESSDRLRACADYMETFN